MPALLRATMDCKRGLILSMRHISDMIGSSKPLDPADVAPYIATAVAMALTTNTGCAVIMPTPGMPSSRDIAGTYTTPIQYVEIPCSRDTVPLRDTTLAHLPRQLLEKLLNKLEEAGTIYNLEIPAWFVKVSKNEATIRYVTLIPGKDYLAIAPTKYSLSIDTVPIQRAKTDVTESKLSSGTCLVTIVTSDGREEKFIMSEMLLDEIYDALSEFSNTQGVSFPTPSIFIMPLFVLKNVRANNVELYYGSCDERRTEYSDGIYRAVFDKCYPVVPVEASASAVVGSDTWVIGVVHEPSTYFIEVDGVYYVFKPQPSAYPGLVEILEGNYSGGRAETVYRLKLFPPRRAAGRLVPVANIYVEPGLAEAVEKVIIEAVEAGRAVVRGGELYVAPDVVEKLRRLGATVVTGRAVRRGLQG